MTTKETTFNVPVQKIADDAACCGVEPDAHVAMSEPTLADAATVFKALSDETRLRIVRAMAHSRSQLCECDIVPQFGLSQSTISHHLKVLREAGILECEKRGLWKYCRVNPRTLMAAVKTLADLA
jgi:ArsR family transcriptional regulator